jgi:type IV secretion system T-DNA border endonuclease VirD1
MRSRVQPIETSGYRVVSVRLRHAEFVGFAEHVKQSGMTNNQALRIAARRIAGFLETDDETRQQLRAISNGLYSISSNLNRLYKAARETGAVDMDELQRERIAFGDKFAQLDEKLRVVLNVSKRRQDGKAMLQKAARP